MFQERLNNKTSESTTLTTSWEKCPETSQGALTSSRWLSGCILWLFMKPSRADPHSINFTQAVVNLLDFYRRVKPFQAFASFFTILCLSQFQLTSISQSTLFISKPDTCPGIRLLGFCKRESGIELLLYTTWWYTIQDLIIIFAH